jgi:hypothetical protein
MSTINFSEDSHYHYRNNNYNYSTLNDKSKKTLYILYWIIGIFGTLFFLQICIILYFFRNNFIYCFNQYCNIFRRYKRKEITIEMGKMSHGVKDNE